MARKRRAPQAAGDREQGWVTAAHGRHYRIEVNGDSVNCVTRGRKSDIACGDRVSFTRGSGGVGVIESVEPRRSLFYRSDARRQKLIAANVTQVIIVVAPVPPFSDDLVSRCLVAAEHAQIGVTIALNKMDLPEGTRAAETLELYRQLGYALVPLAAKSDVAPLRARLGTHVSVLAGQSGMGKSTIINALLPEASARVDTVSAALGSGRHTTTHAELYHLDPQSHIIDSPGLQEFGLHHLTPQDAADAFVEFRPLLGRCRFRDCRHTGEPDCAIAEGERQGTISERRLASYRRLAAELARKRPAWAG